MARELEAARARAEDELMATARMLTSLESRLRSSNREVEQSKLAMEVRGRVWVHGMVGVLG